MAQIECTCLQCGTKFKRWESDIKNGRYKYCSLACKRIGVRKDVVNTCEVCGEEFHLKPHELKKLSGRYCSRECSAKAQSNQIECKCKFCGKPLLRPPSKLALYKDQFCSKKCHYLDMVDQIDVHCEYCGTLFKIWPSENKTRKYCSCECDHLAKTTAIDCICEYCGKHSKKVVSKAKDGRGKYCSRKCAGLAQRGKNSPLWRGGGRHYYGENWISQRDLAYERDGGECQICHRKPHKGERRFAVHHIKPFRRFDGDYISANNLLNLITLCHSCHPKAERGYIYVPKRLL